MSGFVLYNAAHARSSIRSPDNKAWIRVLGFFDTKDAALEHSKMLNSHDVLEPTEIRIAPLKSFRIMLREKMTAKNLVELRERETKKHEFLISTHLKMRSNAMKQTRENAESRTMGETSSLDTLSQIETEPLKVNFSFKNDYDYNNTNKKNVSSVLRDQEIRMQRFAAISIIPDYEVLSKRARDVLAVEADAKRDYINKKNEAFNNATATNSSFVMPTTRELIGAFVEQTPPPSGFNVWGQSLSTDGDIWVPAPNSTLSITSNSEVKAWMKMRDVASEDSFFRILNIEKPVMKETCLEFTDPDDQEEPAVMFLGSAEREDQLEAVIQKIVDTDSSMKHYDIACVAMYEWLSIEEFSNPKLRRKYRDPQLAQLHDARTAHATEAALLAESGGAKNIINIEA